MNQYTVLFVDDEPNILKALQRLFRGDPITVLTCSNAADALELIQRQSIQLLVTDNKMPGMTGVELARKVKELRPEVLRIILSGQSDMDTVLKAVNEGEAYRFILKPWNDLDLKVTINIGLAQYKLVQDNRQLVAELKDQSQLLALLRKQHPEIFDQLLTSLRPALPHSERSNESHTSREKELAQCPKQ